MKNSKESAKKRELFEAAQRRLIAALLADGSAAARVLELIQEEDIEEPSFHLIFSCMAELSRRNEAISTLSVAEMLTNRGQLKEAGGPAVLYQLQVEGEKVLLEAPPQVYARIVKESSAKAKITRTLYDHASFFQDDSGVQAVDGVSDLQASLNETLLRLSDASTITRFAEDFQGYLDLLIERQKVSEANGADAQGLQGIPSLLPSLNRYTTGWLPGQLITVGAKTGVGKALSIDTPILTSNGWRTMADIEVGDFVFSPNGKPTRVTNITEVMENRSCYEVLFSNGATIVADAEHQWLTQTAKHRKYGATPEVFTTQEIFESVYVNGRKNHSVSVSDEVEFPEANLPIDPYIFGYWLGDGHSWSNAIAVHCEDFHNLKTQLDKAGYYYTVNKTQTTYAVTFSSQPIVRGGDTRNKAGSKANLRSLGVLQNKHIPEVYLTASPDQRKALLAGLLDSDGSVSKKVGRVEFGVTRKRLAEDFVKLVQSLGIVSFTTEKRVKGKISETSIAYSIQFKSHFNPFRLERKAIFFRPRKSVSTKYFISKVTPVESVPVRCIEVEDASHMYLAGERLIPTHNSVFAVDCAIAAAKANSSVMFFSLEMSKTEIEDRVLAATTGIPMNRLKQGDLTDEEHRILLAQMKEMAGMKLIIDVEPKVTVDIIRARALRQAQTEAGLDFIIIDYLQLITPTGRFSSRQEAVADISRNVKLLAKQLQVPIMVLVQLNREKDEENALPHLDKIRESGAIAQDSDIVVLLHRDAALDDTTPHTLVILAKNRNGEANKTVRCHSNLECSLFREVTRVKDVERLSESDEADLIEDFDLSEFDDVEFDEDFA